VSQQCDDSFLTSSPTTKHRNYTLNLSKSSNPYFFWPPFAGPAMSSTAHTFITALMSNHSAEYPNGILSKEVPKSFFSITERADRSLFYKPGYERIPDDCRVINLPRIAPNVFISRMILFVFSYREFETSFNLGASTL